jgi:hypothetical protein
MNLDRVHDALMSLDGDRVWRLQTLVFCRQLFDPTMPEVAGFDSRTLVQPIPWTGAIAPASEEAAALRGLTEQLNGMLGGELLITDWPDGPQTARAIQAMADARPDDQHGGGDLQGWILQEYRSKSEISGRGSYFTPWALCQLMVAMTDPRPGTSIHEPAVGTGGMLLAALEHCRRVHGGEPRLAGQDIDAAAVRGCKLNLVLAGYRYWSLMRGLADPMAVTDEDEPRVVEPSPVAALAPAAPPTALGLRPCSCRRCRGLDNELQEAA